MKTIKKTRESEEAVGPQKTTLRGMQLIYRNFAGVAKKYNAQGNRNFSILIEDPSMAQELIDAGWAVREMHDEDGNVSAHHLPCKVNYRFTNPPRIICVGDLSKQRTLLNEGTVGVLDSFRIKYADLTINPYAWNVQGKQGYKAYVVTMYVTVEEDELDLDWLEDEDEM